MKLSKYKHQGVVGFEYVIILIIMSVALFGTFSTLSKTLESKGIDIAEFINNNGQDILGRNYGNPEDYTNGEFKNWHGTSEMIIVDNGPKYFNALMKGKLPEYVYAWDDTNKYLYKEKFTKDDHLLLVQGKNARFYYMIDPRTTPDVSRFKGIQKYKYKDIMLDHKDK